MSMPTPPQPDALWTAKTRRNAALNSVAFVSSCRRGPSPRRHRQGGTLLAVIIGLILVSILGATMAGLLLRSGSGHAQAYDLARARYLAESGISFARTSGQLKAIADGGVPKTIALDAYEQFTVEVVWTNNAYTASAIGVTGVGTARETRQRITRSGLGVLSWDPDTTAPPVKESPTAPVIDDFDDDSVPDWKAKSMDGFIPEPYSHGSGGWIETDFSANQNMEVDGEDTVYSHYIGNEFMFLNRMDALSEAWLANNYQISYEVQVKMMWDYDRRYGLQGLALALSNSDRKKYASSKTQSYNVSLMRYSTENESGNYRSTFDYGYDGIPNSIKPPGLAGHRLLVVWRQVASGNTRQWIAYKDLDHYVGLPGELYIDWVADTWDGYSGWCFKDYATIGARMIEAKSGLNKYRYLQVLRADPNYWYSNWRAGNSTGNDINHLREEYLPEVLGGTFPKWSPLDFSQWSAAQDYFTFQGSLSSDPLKQVKWDGLNTNLVEEVKVMADHGTLRIKDHETDNYGDWSSKDFEIGLNVTGNFNNTLNNRMYFDEFAMRFFKNNTDGLESQGVQY